MRVQIIATVLSLALWVGVCGLLYWFGMGKAQRLREGKFYRASAPAGAETGGEE